MEARIIDVTPPRTKGRGRVWQIETRPHNRAAWARLLGNEHTSADRAAALRTVAANGWRLVELRAFRS